MTTATKQEERTPEQQAQDDAAAFSAGFNQAHGGNLPAEADKPTSEEPGNATASDAETTETGTTTKQPPAESADEMPVLAGLKESEIKALLAKVGDLTEYREKTEKTLQQIFGKFGDIQRQITGSGQTLTKREINAEALKRMNAEYPELAGLLAEDLSGVLAGIPSAGPQTSQAEVDAHVDRVVSERVTKAVDELNEQMLSRFHRDWEDIAKSDDLKLWLGTQPQEYRGKFLESRNAAFISDGLDKFKAWREQGQGTHQKNQRRLEAAIPAKGGSPVGSTAISDADAFSQGFRRVRRG